jgi:hypothetical protein
VNTRINILQWILTKLGTYLVLKRIWNPIDFLGQRSRSPGQIIRHGDMPRFALPLFKFGLYMILVYTGFGLDMFIHDFGLYRFIHDFGLFMVWFKQVSLY